MISDFKFLKLVRVECDFFHNSYGNALRQITSLNELENGRETYKRKHYIGW